MAFLKMGLTYDSVPRFGSRHETQGTYAAGTLFNVGEPLDHQYIDRAVHVYREVYESCPASVTKIRPDLFSSARPENEVTAIGGIVGGVLGNDDLAGMVVDMSVPRSPYDVSPYTRYIHNVLLEASAIYARIDAEAKMAPPDPMEYFRGNDRDIRTRAKDAVEAARLEAESRRQRAADEEERLGHRRRKGREGGESP
jgi:hypothetical protein